MTDTIRQPRLTTPELMARLKRHYLKPGAPLPGGIFLPEVGWNGGNAGCGGCDAIYVGFTTTSGRILVGHELKISRADWLNELNKPGKSDAWADECHEWWLVVADPSIVHDGELPAGWGLMVPGSSKTRMQIKQKPDRKPLTHNPSWLAVRSIMARQDTLRAASESEIKKKARQEASEDNPRVIEAAVSARMSRIPDAHQLGEKLEKIEKALGASVDISDLKRDWHPHGTINLRQLATIGTLCRESQSIEEAVDILTAGYTVRNLRHSMEALEHALANLRAAPNQQMELGA